MPDALERVVNCLVIFVEAGKQPDGRVWIITPWVILEITNVDHEGEVGLVQSRQDTLISCCCTVVYGVSPIRPN